MRPLLFIVSIALLSISQNAVGGVWVPLDAPQASQIDVISVEVLSSSPESYVEKKRSETRDFMTDLGVDSPSFNYCVGMQSNLFELAIVELGCVAFIDEAALDGVACERLKPV